MKKISLLSLVGIALIVGGCANSYPSVNKYTNPKIKNTKLKQQRFKEDSLKCQVFAENTVAMPNRTYYIPSGSGSGNIEMTNIYTGEHYSGTYSTGGGFASGLAAGSAAGAQMGEAIAVKAKQKRAWEYCMLVSGWHEI